MGNGRVTNGRNEWWSTKVFRFFPLVVVVSLTNKHLFLLLSLTFGGKFIKMECHLFGYLGHLGHIHFGIDARENCSKERSERNRKREGPKTVRKNMQNEIFANCSLLSLIDEWNGINEKLSFFRTATPCSGSLQSNILPACFSRLRWFSRYLLLC